MPLNCVYSPLPADHIRILCLHPGESDNPLVATFKYKPMKGRSFDERYERTDILQRDNLAPETMCTPDGYDAISYAWGSSERTHVLHIESLGELGITVSLFGALQRFRSPTVQRRLWADAVCINQEDAVEKATQVASMHTIYTGADMVLIWLGSEVAQDALAFSVMHTYDIRTVSRLRLDDEQILSDLEDKLQSSTKCPCCAQVLEDKSSSLAAAGLVAISKLLERSWFGRLWVVQEVDIRATVGRFYCGKHSIPITEFIMGIYLLSDFLADVRLGLSNKTKLSTRSIISRTVHEYGGREPTTSSFWRSYESFSRRLCSDPRDRIYAIRSCLAMEHLAGLKPDYGIGPEECYRRLSLTMLDEANFPDISNTYAPDTNDRSRVPWLPLSLVGTESNKAASLVLESSWVPDLHHLSERSRDKLSAMTVAFSHDRELYRSCPSRFQLENKPNDNKRIRLRGRCFATLDTPVPPTAWPAIAFDDMSVPGTDHTAVEHIVRWYCHCKEVCLPVLAICGDATAAIFHDLLICRTELMGASPTVHENLIAELSSVWPLSQQSIIQPSLERFLRHYNRAYLDKGRIMCPLQGGGIRDVAWVPKSARAGDQICVVGGAPFPYVLRPCDDGSFKMLGDAFTAVSTLAQALGATYQDHTGRPTNEHATMSWRTEDAEMVTLMDGLGWITLS